MADLTGLTKVYVTADSTQSRDFILKELKKNPALGVTSTAADAQFVLECREGSHKTYGTMMGRHGHDPRKRDV